jgi:uncharacterized protein YuzE
VKIRFDDDADVLYLRLDDSSIVESEEVHPGVVLDFNADDQVVAVEIRGLRKTLPDANMKQVVVEVA